MIILSHRGFWIKENEKNTRSAFSRSFTNGFGTETDIRDSGKKVFIAHDMAAGDELTVKDFFELYKDYNSSLPLALNVKADGLQQAMAGLLKEKEIENYFFFDMSVPDALAYGKHGLSFFTRQSEYEPQPCLYDEASGIWLDEFTTHWIGEKTIEEHIRNGKKICIVSPELHKRSYTAEWEHYRYIINKFGVNDLMLCTDFPLEASKYFNI